jgi:hypothetical protein
MNLPDKRDHARCGRYAIYSCQLCFGRFKAAASHPPAFAVLCRVVAEFGKSLFRQAFIRAGL